ncbi:MAG TPA: butyrate kinase [Candidatus Ozemobacteraceae bacterium]|nr:butyrate kinase [Candidatus Ozemobacteraceae bacterium]
MTVSPRLLVINPGSTTTKIALYEGENVREIHELEHDRAELAKFPTTLSQLEYRRDALRKALAFWNVPVSSLSAVISRGCPLKPLESGVYSINEAMLSDIRSGRLQDHASHLGALLAYEIGEEARIPSFIADPVSVDEFDDVARISGWPELPRGTLSHALNIKAMLRETASERGVEPETMNAVVAHLGGGFSITAIRQGRIVDVNNANDGGPFSPERAGTLPLVGLLKMCFSGKFTYDQLRKMLIGKGGLIAHLGTADVREVVRRIDAGDEKARLVLEAMCYQISKEIGAMAAALCGKVDVIILTGGIAYSSFVVEYVRKRTDFIAPLIIKPGQNELKALAAHALRALSNPAIIKIY